MVLGALFALLGFGAIGVASSYTGATGGYPMTLGAGIAACGAFIIIRAIAKADDAERPLFTAVPPLMVALLGTVIYIAAVVPLGFFTSSTLLMIFLPAGLGFRRPIHLFLVTSLFVGLVWAIFALLLNTPLPKELFLTLLAGG